MRRGARCLANANGHWLLLFAFALGCDPKAGLESAAGAIDPNEKSYLDAPGSQLSAGPFNTIGIDYDPDTSVHLLSRRRDDDGTSMTLFGQNSQTGCRIAPNVATWFASRPAQKPSRLLPYFEARDANGVGTLRFSSVDCKVEPYSVENALGPSDPDIDIGFLIHQNGGLVVADPWQGTTTPIVASLSHVYQLSDQILVWGDGQLIRFDRSMNELARFGKNVKAVTSIELNAGFAVEDDDGVNELVFDNDTQGYEYKSFDKDACALGTTGAFLGWIVVHSPCSDEHLVAENLDSAGNAEHVSFNAQADSRLAEIVGDSRALNADPHALTAYYLDNPDPATGLGKLYAATPDSAPLAIGENAALERANVLRADDTWTGIALVDVENDVGRLVRWNWSGNNETVLEGVLRFASVPGTLANYDGVAGDVYTLDAETHPTLYQTGSPAFNTLLNNSDFSDALRLDKFDGVVGELEGALGATANFGPVAENVPAGQYQFTSIIPLPGFAYIADYNQKNATGTLYVQNTTLGATSKIATGVSDFLATNYPLPGILYTVPLGSNAGIWFARAK